MEEVWLKTEPIDEKFETCLSKEWEDGISTDTINSAAPTILLIPINKEEQPEAASEHVFVECAQTTEYAASASQFTNHIKQKLTTEKSGEKSEKKVVQSKRLKSSAKSSKNKSREETHQGKQTEERTTETSTKKRLSKKETQKRSFCCETCGKEFTAYSGYHRHKLLHSGIER